MTEEAEKRKELKPVEVEALYAIYENLPKIAKALERIAEYLSLIGE